MTTLLIAIGSMIGYLVAYHTYGRWLARKIFHLDPAASVPSIELNDDRDFVPTAKSVLFGHHFTSIAGTGPIVGPAIAVMWGWLPALVWILLGSVLVGAVHDSYSGAPIAGASVSTHENNWIDSEFTRLLSGTMPMPLTLKTVKTGEDGSFQLPLMTPGNYQVRIKHD